MRHGNVEHRHEHCENNCSLEFATRWHCPFYRAWLADGPPTPNPEGCLFSAGNFLSWALAFLSAGVGVFLLIGSLPSLSRAAVVLLILASILGVIPSIREYLASDSCLDAGGKWSALELRCVHE